MHARHPSRRQHDNLKIIRARHSLDGRSVVLIDLQFFCEALNHVQQEMDVDAIFIDRVSFYGYSLFNHGWLSRITQFEFQATLVVDDPNSATGQLFGYLLFAGKVRSSESLHDLRFRGSRFAKMLFDLHAPLGLNSAG